MNKGIEQLVTVDDLVFFRENGVVILRDIFTDWIEGARKAVEENIKNPSWRERTYCSDDGQSPFFQDYVVWNRFDGYRNLVKKSPMAALAAKLMQSRTARIFHDHILVKEPGNSTVTPWHQDQPYYLTEGEQTVSFWVPLDSIPRHRTIEYVAGSHLWDRKFKPQRFDGTDLFEHDESPQVPNVEALRSKLTILGWEMSPGDAVAFSFRTLHGAPANQSTSRRRVISLRWVGDDAVFVKRKGKTSPAFPEIEYEHNAPFGGEQFPVLCNLV